jgi:hypothetical protein
MFVTEAQTHSTHKKRVAVGSTQNAAREMWLARHVAQPRLTRIAPCFFVLLSLLHLSGALPHLLINSTDPLNLNPMLPKVYIYDLPSKFNAHWIPRDKPADGNSLVDIGYIHIQGLDASLHLILAGLGAQIFFSQTTDNNRYSASMLKELVAKREELVANHAHYLTIRATDMFNLEVIMHHRLLHSPLRTENPNEADLFFVPYYAARQHLQVYNFNQSASLTEELVDWLRRQSPYFAHNGGRDHVMAFGMIEREMRMTSPSSTNVLSHPAFKNMVLIGIEQSAYRHAPTASRVVVAPYPSSVHFSSQPPAHPSIHSRPLLVTYIGTGKDLNLRISIKTQLQDCEDCLYVDLESMRGFEHGEYLVLQYSTFCLQPRGDSYTRKGFFDSLLLGKNSCANLTPSLRVQGAVTHTFVLTSRVYPSAIFEEHQIPFRYATRLQH